MTETTAPAAPMPAFDAVALVDAIIEETAAGEMAWSEPDQHDTIRATWRGLAVSLQTKRGSQATYSILTVNGVSIKQPNDKGEPGNRFQHTDRLIAALSGGIAAKLEAKARTVFHRKPGAGGGN